MEDQKSLESSTVISKLAHTIKHKVNNLLANSVMTTGIVVGSVFLARNNLLGMVKLAVMSRADFVANSWLQVNENSTRNMLSSTSLGEKGVKGVISTTNCLIRRHLPIWLNTML